MSARAPSETGSFWMIMSMFTLRLGEHGRDAARDARGVRDALEGDARLLGGVRDGGDERLFHGLFLSDHNGTRSVLEARDGQWMRTPWLRAYSTERSCSTPAPEADISSISSKETTASLRASGTIRGSALKTPATSV